MNQKDLIQKSFIDVTEEDLNQVDKESLPERAWHKSTPRYQTNQDIQEGFNEGELVKVERTKDYRPITRLLNPDTDLQYPPYLKRAAKSSLDEIASLWRIRLTKEFGDRFNNALLAVTFLICSEDYRKELLKTPGKILNGEGTHSTGYTFDIDASSYYIVDEENFYSVADPRRNKAIIKKSTQNLAKIGGSKMHTLTSNEVYEQRVTDILVECAQELAKRGSINLIIEYEGTQNRCIHVCTKP